MLPTDNRLNTTTATAHRASSMTILEKAIRSQSSLILLIGIGCVGYFQLLPNILLTSMVAIIAFKELYTKINRGLPLLELGNIIAVLQWLVGPALSYFLGMDHYRYKMYVDETVFFSYALPATCGFSAAILGLGYFANQRPLIGNQDKLFYFSLGIYLLIIAFAAEIVAERAPVALQFFFHLLSQLRYVATLYFLFSSSPYKYPAAVISLSSLFIRSSSSGMFHDLLLWAALVFCIWFPAALWLHRRKAIIFVIAGLAIFAIQVIKQDYRERIAKGEAPSLVLMAFDYISPSGKAWDQDVLSLALVRLNQGWIISAVMSNVPRFEPYAGGSTVFDATVATVVPRFLLPNKAKAGGKENFRRFTGLPIGEGTSMSICVLGEAYANFGDTGGIAFMVLFGAIYAIYYKKVLDFALKHPDFLFWIPLIFYQAIKAETDLVVITNQIIKGSIIAFGGYLAVHKYLPLPRQSQ
jgi:hypothetical protein